MVMERRTFSTELRVVFTSEIKISPKGDYIKGGNSIVLKDFKTIDKKLLSKNIQKSTYFD